VAGKFPGGRPGCGDGCLRCPALMTASRIPSVSAVLPAYNEVAVIAQTVRRTHAALLACGVTDFEVVVVDDGSTDGTAAAVATAAEELGRVVLVRHDRNRGYGGALLCAELARRARRRGGRVVEVPVPHQPRTTGTATGADPRVVARAFAELWRMRREGVEAQPRAGSGRRGGDDRD